MQKPVIGEVSRTCSKLYPSLKTCRRGAPNIASGFGAGLECRALRYLPRLDQPHSSHTNPLHRYVWPVSQDLCQALATDSGSLNAHEPQAGMGRDAPLVMQSRLIQNVNQEDAEPMTTTTMLACQNGCTIEGARPCIVQVGHGRNNPHRPGHSHGLSFMLAGQCVVSAKLTSTVQPRRSIVIRRECE